MSPTPDRASHWVYPDRDAWQELLRLRCHPRAVAAKPHWWPGPWAGSFPGQPNEAALADARVLAMLRQEFTWAMRCFYFAEATLDDPRASAIAGRVADALDRARRSLDSPAKADGLREAVANLSGIGRYDPSKYPRGFIETASRSLQAVGRVLEGSSFSTLTYWGRVFRRFGASFARSVHGLPTGE